MQRWQRPIYNSIYKNWNLILIKNVKDPVVFQTRKVIISGSFSIASLTQETVKEDKQFKEKNIDI